LIPIETLPGQYVTLEPLNTAKHGAALWDSLRGPQNDDLWLYLADGPYAAREDFDQALEKIALSRLDPLFFAIVDNASRRALGRASYLRIEPPHRCLEVGGILYSPLLQKTRGATEAMYLMARHAFDTLGYRRYEWKCNALNTPSRHAALRLGFTFEGIFRQHMLIKGRNRDTAWFSMLDHEWPARRQALERWLDPANFNAGGEQIRSLSSLREF
jgi:RimJ/RimL family protein N-acetyltransferase